MPRAYQHYPLTHERLKDLIDYDPESGLLIWKLRRSSRAEINSEAGHTRHQRGKPIKVITIDGRTYMANRVAWFHKVGQWPVGRLTARDGDLSNIAFKNMLLENENTLATPRAAYQRLYRRKQRGMLQGMTPAQIAAIKDPNNPLDPNNKDIFTPTERRSRKVSILREQEAYRDEQRAAEKDRIERAKLTSPKK